VSEGHPNTLTESRSAVPSVDQWLRKWA